MIKRIIFDIDNTLIPFKKRYFEEIKNVLKDLEIKYTDKDYNEILKAFSEYENIYYTFNRKLMIDFINKYTKKQYPEEFMYKMTERWSNCGIDEIEEGIKETLEYLQTKYELVILSDWYKDQQVKKLEKADFLKYFKNIYTAENTRRKPFKEAFMKAIGDNKPEECIMVGDDLERDIKGALNVGLQAIWYNPNNTLQDKEYQIITKIEQLKTIL